MDRSSSTYLTLPSNASLAYYPDNTLSSYTVKLDPPLHLEGAYEVGLSEICYPRSWVNVRDNEARLSLQVHRHRPPPGDSASSLQQRVVTLPGGQYDSAQHLIDSLRRQTSFHFKSVQFQYDEPSRKVAITVPRNLTVKLSPLLKDILGFQDDTLVGFRRGERVVDLNRGFTALYVYASVVQDRIVGDTRAPLLRMVPARGKHGDIVFQTYHDVHFLPVAFNSFDRVTINIRNGAGDLVPFETGQVVVTLQLRPRPYGS
ncbi:hypothetical protein BaRGS_00008427 [Batillaria attramentaria]|uniref:Uncharacterized protein n=1 Tax=Batillaria attramentaria TaxID=370345 RepID=A0ABD0LL23_9CAEN